MSELEWQKRAACGAAPVVDQIAFTSPGKAGRGGGNPLQRLKDLSERYCNGCPVLAECRDWAEGDEYFIGVAAAKAYTNEYRALQQTERNEKRRAVVVAGAEEAYEEWKS